MIRSQPRFFDVDNCLKRLRCFGDRPEALHAAVDFGIVRADLTAVVYSDGAQGGRPPFDPVAVFKILVIYEGFCGRKELLDQTNTACLVLATIVDHNFVAINRLKTDYPYATILSALRLSENREKDFLQSDFRWFSAKCQKYREILEYAPFDRKSWKQ